MASISITNVSVNYTGDAFQGKVDFDLNCTPTEARLNVGFRINLAAQLNFEAIDYGSNEFAEWCKNYSSIDINSEAWAVARLLRDNPDNYQLTSYMGSYLENTRYFTFNGLAEVVTPSIFYKALIEYWNLTPQNRLQLSNVLVVYPEQQTSSSHAVEFSVLKEPLFNPFFQNIESEMRAQFLALAGHQLDVWLSAELDWGNANTQGRCEYTVG